MHIPANSVAGPPLQWYIPVDPLASPSSKWPIPADYLASSSLHFPIQYLPSIKFYLEIALFMDCWFVWRKGSPLTLLCQDSKLYHSSFITTGNMFRCLADVHLCTYYVQPKTSSTSTECPFEVDSGSMPIILLWHKCAPTKASRGWKYPVVGLVQTLYRQSQFPASRTCLLYKS